MISRAESDSNGVARWLCLCDCGTQKVVRGRSLRAGRTKSCGCSRHNLKHSRLYHIWCGLKQRTCNPCSPRYNDYGGRGITVCEEWLTDFLTFYQWAMTHGYSDNLTIERIDNDGPYSPKNCRWATHIEQGNNKRNNHIVEYNGESHTLAEWSDITGINYYTLKTRFARGWTPEKALTSLPRITKK